MIHPYRRKTQYYETDQMGIIHHANYIKWLEEARLDFFGQIGISYRRMEEIGILCPILDVSCKYKRILRFGDTVLITVSIAKYTGVKLVLSYEVTNEVNGEICTVAETTLCFMDRENKLISLKYAHPELHEILMNLK